MVNLKDIFSRTHLFFSSHFRAFPDGTRNAFIYQNDSASPEVARVLLFPSTGVKDGCALIEKRLLPNDSIVVRSDEIAKQLPGVHMGTVLLCLQIEGPLEDSRFRKELVSDWLSLGKGATRGAMTSAGPFSVLNTAETKPTRSFFMFSPVVFRPGAVQTENVLINHSTDPNYADRIEIMPLLSNLNGEVIEGKPVVLEPFGCGIIDIERTFGQRGVEALARTNGYGFHRVRQQGYIFVSYFFQLDQDGDVICGNHTQPPNILLRTTSGQLWKQKIKIMFPWLLYLKNARTSMLDTHA